MKVHTIESLRYLLLIPGITLLMISCKVSSQDQQVSLDDKVEGMLIGSAIGDAAGGPVEFVSPAIRSYWSTTGEKLSHKGLEELAGLFELRSYPKEAEPFAQWEAFGPPGTITDDTRFKMILFNTLKNQQGDLSLETFAQSVLDFRDELPEHYRDNYDEWIPEIEFATRWALGERENAYPVERIWGGIPTMEGQMPFLPIAALNPDDPEWCYIKTYELGYFDTGVAKDMNSALVAGLARALQPDGSWQNMEEAMRTVDPYGYNKTLYVERELVRWLNLLVGSLGTHRCGIRGGRIGRLPSPGIHADHHGVRARHRFIRSGNGCHSGSHSRKRGIPGFHAEYGEPAHERAVQPEHR